MPMMCLADKVALCLCVVLAAALWILCSIGTPAEEAPIVSGYQFLIMFAEAWWAIASKTILPLWIVLRILDAITGGPQRRRALRGGRVTARSCVSPSRQQRPCRPRSGIYQQRRDLRRQFALRELI